LDERCEGAPFRCARDTYNHVQELSISDEPSFIRNGRGSRAIRLPCLWLLPVLPSWPLFCSSQLLCAKEERFVRALRAVQAG
jgi:hypothetical protein